MEIICLPVISTAHVTQEVAERLTNEGNNNPWCPGASWEHGFFLHLDELEARSSETVTIPQCLIDIRNWLRAQNLRSTNGVRSMRTDWVRLDQDADVAEGLPSYDW
ncbi:hypothetical protein [Pseudomonas violetae]|uniref:DUF5983 domain-containing protein n=1 Tax=Pseudomonas violetae TaxID=2915813 RepID=A0ABT0ETD4_9PSED|nr:hypothetical protein [Pseudomonas violetae]MCK1789002.1 hypothetical protein [Pseudomonas violetae]